MTACRNYSVTFRADLGGQYGIGHFARCAALAAEMNPAIDVTIHASFGGDIAHLPAHDPGLHVVTVPPGASLDHETALLTDHGTQQHAVVLDIAHTQNVERKNHVRILCEKLKQADVRIALIDGLSPIVLVTQSPFPIDLYIAPYAGARSLEDASFKQLIGPDYFVAPQMLEEQQTQYDPDKLGARLLVTFGGTDPGELTIKALKAIALIERKDIEIKVIVGPGFVPALREKVDAHVAELAGRAEILDAPRSLWQHFQWSNLVLSGTGLTKYEIAAAGRPAILMSHDFAHAQANAGFAALGVAQDLGAADTISNEHLAASIENLFADPAMRRAMAQQGLRSIDGHGATRVAAAIQELVDA